MRSEESPLDLNNLPEDYTRDGMPQQASEDSSSSAVAGGYRKKKSGAEEANKLDDEELEPGNKVYECRFCSLKFCKSQALGGHMNRHRQGIIKRETETLNKARQLVFTNDLAPGHLGYVSGGHPISNGGYHQAAGNIGDPAMPFRSMYPTSLFPTTSALIPQPPPPPSQVPPYMYTSPPRLLPFPASQFPAPPKDYFVGHVLSTPTEGSNYTCIGAPVGHRFPNGGTGGRGLKTTAAAGGGGARDLSMHNQQEDQGRNWGRR